MSLDLQSKAEAATKALVDAVGLSGVTVFTGLEDETQALPAVFCIAENFNQELQGVGNYRGTIRVRVKSNSNDTTLADHRTRAAAVFDALVIETLSTALTAAVADFTCQFIFSFQLEQSVTDGQSFNSGLLIEGIFCGSTLAGY